MARHIELTQILEQNMMEAIGLRQPIQGRVPDQRDSWNIAAVMDKILKKLPKRKARGSDEISFEILVQFKELTKTSMSFLAKRMIESGELPNGWNNSRIVVLPKGDPMSEFAA